MAGGTLAARPGPAGTVGDAELVALIRRVLADSPFCGEGYRKVRARLRREHQVHVAGKRVLRLMRAEGLLAPQRAHRRRSPRLHEGRIVTDALNVRWGTDGTMAYTLDDGWVWVFDVIDHHSAEAWAHVAKVGDRFGALAITRLGLWHELGLLGWPARLRTLAWFLPFVAFGVLPWITVSHLTPAVAAAVVAFGVLNAFWKLGFLGLLMYAWLPRGERFAAAVAAGVWGVMHLAGILLGARVVPTLVLAASYVLLSFGFAGVWMRTRLLWPLVGAYALLEGSAVAIFRDSGAGNLATSAADLLPLMASSLLLAGYGLLALPRRKTSEEPGLRGRVVGGTA